MAPYFTRMMGFAEVLVRLIFVNRGFASLVFELGMSEPGAQEA
jgi:hypothetical protein